MIFEKAINEVKKGCGKECDIKTFWYDEGKYDEDLIYCGEKITNLNTREETLELCSTCQKELDTLQKCSNAVEEVFRKLDSRINENFMLEQNACIYFSEFETAKEQLKEVELK